ncbi:MAG: hypothetical protein IJ646_04165 [Clostridia bacterium]|nr:hypothetical protein [Clostridia bacterium]
MATVKTMINSPTYGKFYFDAVFSTEHSANVTVTEHPVQVGAPISDHAYQEPDEVTMEIGMSDAMVGVSSDHSVNAFSTLRQIMVKREPVKLVTRLKTYSNMVLTSISAPDDQSTMYGLRATVMFRSVNIVTVSVIKVQQTVSASKPSSSSSSKKSSSSSKKKSTKTKSTKKTTKSTGTKGKKTSVLKKIAKKVTK